MTCILAHPWRSMVVGKDVISRLSLRTAKRLVDDMVTTLARQGAPLFNERLPHHHLLQLSPLAATPKRCPNKPRSAAKPPGPRCALAPTELRSGPAADPPLLTPPLLYLHTRPPPRCKRPKLRVLWDYLTSSKGAALSPLTFCAFREMDDAAVRALEGCASDLCSTTCMCFFSIVTSSLSGLVYGGPPAQP